MSTRCPACGRRPRLTTPARQVCDYCDTRWCRTPQGPRDVRLGEQAAWALGEPERADPSALRRVTLGVLTGERDLDAALRLAARLAPRLGGAAVLLDAGASPTADLPADTTLHARPLAGHFGAQRTALQRLARTPWMLQLDTDEDIGANALARLPALLRAAERDGIAALGLPRRNRVDGVLSDHYPDPQYRLCRRTVAYEGQVHERPVVTNRARRTRLALGVPIEHAISAARVRQRTARYDAMSAGATDTARRGDEAALLTPFRP